MLSLSLFLFRLALLWSTFSGKRITPLVNALTPIRLSGINYNTRQGPDWYDDAARCKNHTEIFAELAVLSQLTGRIRILSCSDCTQGPMVWQALQDLAKSGITLELWLGLWVSDDETVFQDELACLEGLIPQFTDQLMGVSVGSEAIYRKDVTVAQNIEYANSAKQVLASAGRSDIPVAICDIVDSFGVYPELISTNTTDVILANVFPFWEKVPIDDAVDFLIDYKIPNVEAAAKLAGKPFIIGETGWSSAGEDNRTSLASPENQAQYFQDFYCVGDRQEGLAYYWFTGFDTPWRIKQDENVDSVEGHFGIFNTDLTMKSHFVDLQFQCPGSSEVYGFVLKNATVSLPTTSPTVSAPPVDAPVSSPVVLSPESCAANAECADLGLGGDCCPAPDGTFLGCCSSAGALPSVSPTPSPSAATNTDPTSSPSPTTTPITNNDDVPSRPSDMPSSVPSPLFLTSRPTFFVGSPSPAPTINLTDSTSDATGTRQTKSSFCRLFLGLVALFAIVLC